MISLCAGRSCSLLFPVRRFGGLFLRLFAFLFVLMRQLFDPAAQILIEKQPQGDFHKDPEPQPPFQFQTQLHDLFFIVAADPDMVPEDRIEAVKRAHDLPGLCRIVKAKLSLHQEVRGLQMTAELLQLPADEAQRFPVLFIVPIALEFIDLPGDLIELLLDLGKFRQIFRRFFSRFTLGLAGGFCRSARRRFRSSCLLRVLLFGGLRFGSRTYLFRSRLRFFGRRLIICGLMLFLRGSGGIGGGTWRCEEGSGRRIVGCP